MSSSSSYDEESWTASDAAEVRERLDLWPLDEHNLRLINEVRPKRWSSSSSRAEDEDVVYDLVAIGAGAGGLVCSRQVARRGGRSAMVSERLAGGDCLNAGCVPSKALLRSARRVREVRRAATAPEFGGGDGDAFEVPPVDFPAIARRMRSLRAAIAPVDGHRRGVEIGCDVVQGRGRFKHERTIEVTDPVTGEVVRTLRFRTAVVATGGRPFVPTDVPGLDDDCPYTTNETLFNLSERLPARMVILGSGVVALEMAQTFATFGTEVTVLVRSDGLFPKADDDVGRSLRAALEEDEVIFRTRAKVARVETLRRPTTDDELPLLRVHLAADNDDDDDEALECECLLVAAGRAANVEDLGLDEAGVEYEIGPGVVVDDLGRSTTNPRVYAVGDCVAGLPRLTHASGETAKLVVQNALFDDDWRLSDLVVPACVYTEPEYASAGVVKADPTLHDTYEATLEHNDRAILEDGVDRRRGFAKIFTKKGTGDVVGCVVVAERAGEMINEVTLAMKHGVPLEGIGRNVHCYPTTGEVLMTCGLQRINSRWKRLDERE